MCPDGYTHYNNICIWRPAIVPACEPGYTRNGQDCLWDGPDGFKRPTSKIRSVGPAADSAIGLPEEGKKEKRN